MWRTSDDVSVGRVFMLEVIVRRSESQMRATPLLFVHGTLHAAWRWEEFFFPELARQG
jgi:hypothetical protein